MFDSEGSLVDGDGVPANGTIYFWIPGQVMTARAVTLDRFDRPRALLRMDQQCDLGGWMVSEMMGTISNCANDDRGFTLIESLIAIGVLAVGLLSVAAGFASGMQQMTGSNFDFIAREKAAEAIESVFTARDTRTITWAMIANVAGESGSDGGVFKDDPQPLKLTGNDGLVNTADDSATNESIPQPGPDGLLGSADDTQLTLNAFTREIVIREIGPTLRSLRVVIRYVVGGQTREYIIDTYISSYA